MHAPRSLGVLLRAPVLDRQLITGVDPSYDADLVARAARVCSPRWRERLADGLERVLAEAQAPTGGTALTASAPIARDDVREARALILDVVRRLRSSAPVDPQGVLLIRRLLSDPASPLSRRSPGVPLKAALREANRALTPR